MVSLKAIKLVAALIMLLVSIPPVIALQPATLELRVTDCSTHAPIPNARVDVTERVVDPTPDPTKYTGEDGVVVFKFNIGSQTSYSVAVSADGYNPDGTVAFLYPEMETIRTICLNKGSYATPPEGQSCSTVITVSVSPKTVYQGDIVTISGSVTASNNPSIHIDPPVYIFVDGTSATLGTDSSGYYSALYTTSSLSLGSHTIRAESTIDSCTKGSATDTFTVISRAQYCTLDVYVWDQNSNPLDASVSIAGRSIGYGPHVTQQVTVGSYTVSASKSGYSSDSKTVSCSCSQTVRVDLILRKTQVCTPYTIRNKACVSGCSTQYVYEICKNDGSVWETGSGTCQSGQVCKNGECVTPSAVCTEGYTNDFNCFGSVRKQKYVFSDCSFTWNFKEECPENQVCQNGECVPLAPTCNEGYVNNFICSGNARKQKYVYSNCHVEFITVENCPYGCSNGNCLPAPTCTAGYLDTTPICSGNWIQKEYRFSNCATEWRNYQQCDNGCSGGNCLPTPCPQPCPAPCPQPTCPTPCSTCPVTCPTCHATCPSCQTHCSASVSVGTPSDIAVGNTIQTTVTITNNGNNGGYVSFDAYVCESSGNCYIMNCNGATGDPTVYVDAYGSRTVTCTATARNNCDPYIKVQYSGCGVSDTIYSNYFRIVERGRCSQGFTKNWRMDGNWKQYEYVYSDCSKEWRNYEYMPTVEPVTTTKGVSLPMVALDAEYNVKACEISTIEFQVVNAGNQKAKFYLRKSGAAADWIQLEPEIVVDAKESKTVTAYVSVPCDAEGRKAFTIRVLDGTTTGATSFLDITAEEKPFMGLTAFNALVDFTVGMWPWLLLFVLFLLALLLFALAGKNHNRRGSPESFTVKNFKPFREECC